MRALAFLLVCLALGACRDTTAPEKPLYCVRRATIVMPDGWTASMWASPYKGVACVIPPNGVAP